MSLPTNGRAWSDQTALLMADMAKLAYIGFEVGANGVMSQADLERAIEPIVGAGELSAIGDSTNSEDSDRYAGVPDGAGFTEI